MTDLTKLDALYEAAAAPESDFQDAIRAKTALFNEYPAIRAALEGRDEALNVILLAAEDEAMTDSCKLNIIRDRARTALNKGEGDA